MLWAGQILSEIGPHGGGGISSKARAALGRWSHILMDGGLSCFLQASMGRVLRWLVRPRRGSGSWPGWPPHVVAVAGGRSGCTSPAPRSDILLRIEPTGTSPSRSHACLASRPVFIATHQINTVWFKGFRVSRVLCRSCAVGGPGWPAPAVQQTSRVHERRGRGQVERGQVERGQVEPGRRIGQTNFARALLEVQQVGGGVGGPRAGCAPLASVEGEGFAIQEPAGVLLGAPLGRLLGDLALASWRGCRLDLIHFIYD
jgi:hypothetical protein